MSTDQGMEAVADTFTDADREMLRELQHRELAHTIEPVLKVKAGTVVRGHEKREVFTFNSPDTGTFLFDVRSIKNAIVSGAIPTKMYRLEDIPEHFYQHVLNNNGVEPDRLSKLSRRDLECPGIMVMWSDTHHTMIDGNHRLCRRYMMKLKSFRFLLVHVIHCAPFMCRPGDEDKLFGREDNPDVHVLHTEIRIEE